MRLGPPFARALGGLWVSTPTGPPSADATVELLDATHPVNLGVDLGTMQDELYPSPRLEPRAVPLWRVPDGEAGKPLTVAWAYERPDGGRSFATTLGHYDANSSVPSSATRSSTRSCGAWSLDSWTRLRGVRDVLHRSGRPL